MLASTALWTGEEPLVRHTFAGVFVSMHTQLSMHLCMLHGGACMNVYTLRNMHT